MVLTMTLRRHGISNINSNATLVCGVGTFGNGKHKSRCKKYDTWRQMLNRCYKFEKYKNNHVYSDVSVCDLWLDYQNFGDWYDENFYSVKDEHMSLDKDILTKHNRIYSPENCIFVPKPINSLFTKDNIARGKYPIGVDFHKQKGLFRARCSNLILGKSNITIGEYTTVEEAFYAYRNYKEKLIKQIADVYREYIPVRLYQALYKYEVEITD